MRETAQLLSSPSWTSFGGCAEVLSQRSSTHLTSRWRRWRPLRTLSGSTSLSPRRPKRRRPCKNYGRARPASCPISVTPALIRRVAPLVLGRSRKRLRAVRPFQARKQALQPISRVRMGRRRPGRRHRLCAGDVGAQGRSWSRRRQGEAEGVSGWRAQRRRWEPPELVWDDARQGSGNDFPSSFHSGSAGGAGGGPCSQVDEGAVGRKDATSSLRSGRLTTRRLHGVAAAAPHA